MRKKIYHFTNIPSHYRTNLWEKLISEKRFDFHFFFGINNNLGIKEIEFNTKDFNANKSKLHYLTNYWIKNRILIWQSKVVRTCLSKKFDVAIFLGELQVLSTWLAIVLCKIRGIKTVFWTHGLYGNESALKRKMRVLFYNLADEILLYERRAKKLLKNEGIRDDKIKVIYNSLDYDTQLEIRNQLLKEKPKKESLFTNNTVPYLVFIGRLTKIKKLDLLLKAVANINKNTLKLNVLVIGDGDEMMGLKNLTKILHLEKNVHFLGALYDEYKIAELLFNSVLCVSPGNVGLTAIHSLSFGTPICTHSNFFNQMPEVEVIEEGLTGTFFEENNLESLESSISKWLNMNLERTTIRENCFNVIDSLYNPYNQINILSKL